MQMNQQTKNHDLMLLLGNQAIARGAWKPACGLLPAIPARQARK